MSLKIQKNKNFVLLPRTLEAIALHMSPTKSGTLNSFEVSLLKSKCQL